MGEQIPTTNQVAAPVQSIFLVLPEHSNHYGFIHGAWLMRLADESGGLAAVRHAKHPVMTVSVEQMHFRKPVPVGSILQIHAQVVWTGTSSLETDVNISIEDPLHGTAEVVFTGTLVFVALDKQGRPVQIPAFVPNGDEQMARFEKTQARRATK